MIAPTVSIIEIVRCSREHFSPTLALCPYCRADGIEAPALQEQPT